MTDYAPKKVHPYQTATIEIVKAGRKGFKTTAGEWFGSKFKSVPEWVQAGMMVEFSYGEGTTFFQGDFKRVEGAEYAKPIPSGSRTAAKPAAFDDSGKYDKKPAHPEDAKRMSRSVALKEANLAVTAAGVELFDTHVDSVINMARQFEAYLDGSIDEEVNKEAMSQMMAMGSLDEPMIG